MEIENTTILNDVILKRFSPRAFQNKRIDPSELESLFEAACWAASSMNEQPWLFHYAEKGEAEYEMILDSLMPGNKVWAQEAPILMVNYYKEVFDKNGSFNRSAMHDLGLAMGNMSIQATTLNIGLHMMGGFNPEIITKKFELPDGYVPFCVVAIGYFGDPNSLDEPLKSRETAERKRKKLSEIVFHKQIKK